MPIGFPTGVSQGTTHTIGQVTWEWNGYAWEVVVSTIAGLSGAPGATGNTGPTGVGISGASLSNYELLITYTNGVTQNIGYIRGDTGSPGLTGSPGTAGTPGSTGNTGNTGVGISGATLVNYELIFTYTTGLTQNVGYIRGETGTPGTNGATGNTGNTGVGISGATLTNYELIFTYTNGTTQNIGNIRGATGADGQATSSGAAGTKTYAIFTPLNNEPPATNYATIDTRNSIMVLDFDPTTQESAVFRSIMPEGASFTSLVAYIWAMATTAVTGDIIWGVQYDGMTGSDLDTDTFSTGVTKAMTTSGISGQATGITISTSSFDGITVGDPYRVKIYRAAAEAGDNLIGDAELLAVEIRGA